MKIDLKNRTGTIDLRSGHSLVAGFKPEKITSEMYNDTIAPEVIKNIDKIGLETFGLWDSSTPNYATYYPDVKPEDLQPKEEDFIYPMFRCLSATVLWKGYRPIDFSKPGVLKASMSKLVAQTIHIDHETQLGNGIGSVKSVVWQEAYKVDGVTVPAGINGEFMIDGKSNPRIARGIMSKPPIYHSNSVSVRFKWEPSHKMDSENEFWNKLGSYDEKGNLYRLIVTEIIQYSETSLVAHGADAYAQIIKEDGTINNPKYADGVYNFSSVDANTEKEIPFSHFIDYKVDLTSDTTPLQLNNNNHNNQNSESMEILLALEVILGLDKDSLKDADTAKLTEAIDNFKAQSISETAEKLTTAEGKVTKLEGEKAELQRKLDEQGSGDNAELTSKASKYDAIILNDRAEAKRLYALAKGVDASAETLTMLDTCSPDTLAALSSEYKSSVDAKFPTTCNSCGSTDLSKASSKNDDDTNGGKDGKTKLTVTQKKESLKNKVRNRDKK